MPLKKAFDRQAILVYPWYISDVVATKTMGRVTGGRVIKKIFMYIRDDLTTMYYDEASTNSVGRWILNQIIKDHKFYRRVMAQIYRYSDRLMAFSRNLSALRPARLSDRQLLKIYADYEKVLGELRAWGWVPPFLDGVFEPFLSNYLMDRFSAFLRSVGQADRLPDYYSMLSTSEKMSEVQTETLARLELLLKIQKHRSGRAAVAALLKGKTADFLTRFAWAAPGLRRHLKDFGWLTYAYAGPVMSAEYLYKVLAGDLKNGDVNGQIKKIKEHFRTIAGEKAALRKKLGLPRDLAYLFAVSADLMFIKDYRKGIYQRSYVAMDKVMAELARRLNISDREIRNLIYAEVREALLRGPKLAYQKRATQRTRLAAYTISAGRIKVYEGQAAERLIAKTVKGASGSAGGRQSESRTKEIKGSIAYAGVVRGRVKIILVKADVPKLKPGEILVSSATNPDLISAMKKAAAFVTDTGGIICHAAIVARELKKPCVIGTKNATKILRDGDYVEVDARAGVVRILNK